MRHRILVLLFSSAALVVCCEMNAKEIDGYGTVIDPDGDCKIDAAEGVVRFKMPKSKHDLWYGGKDAKTRFNSPRVWQEVEGNFTVIVRVTAHWSANLAKGGFNGAGLVVWDSEKQYLRHERNRMVNTSIGTAEFSYTTPLYDQNNRRVFFNSTREEFFQGKSTWLQIVRQGSQIITSISHDGKSWTTTGVVDTEFPDEVQVGIHCTNSTGKEFAVYFDQFSLKRR